MTVVLDARCMTRENAHDYLKQMLRLPDWYGANLDALHDCLTDLPETTLVIEHAAQAEEYFLRVRRVLHAAARDNPALTVHIIQ